MPKYVVSTTLTSPEWANTQVIGGNVAAEITRLCGAVPATGFPLADATTLSDGLVILNYQTDKGLG